MGLLWGLLALALAYGHWGRAAMLVLIFHCPLRRGEAMELVRGDLRFPGDANWQAGCRSVVLRSPKMAKRRSQRVIVADRAVVVLCRAAWQTWPPTRKLALVSTKEFEVWF